MITVVNRGVGQDQFERNRPTSHLSIEGGLQKQPSAVPGLSQRMRLWAHQTVINAWFVAKDDAFKRAARCVNTLTIDLEGDERTQRHATEASQNYALNEEPIAQRLHRRHLLHFSTVVQSYRVWQVK